MRVRRLVGAFAPGRVLNPKLARSQLMGGMLWGLGQALLEGNRMDPRHGRWGAANLGEYLVPVNADAPDVTVEFVEVTDDVVNPLGVKGVGEIGQVGVGRRDRERRLPRDRAPRPRAADGARAGDGPAGMTAASPARVGRASRRSPPSAWRGCCSSSRWRC